MTLKIISLFSWCWWKDLWFIGNFDFLWKHYSKNPFEIVWANDNFLDACKTYGYNISNHIAYGDIKEIDIKSIPDADIVIGGFPCQDFSVAGKRKWLSADRWRLFLNMLEIIKQKKPVAFIAENVKWLMNIDKWEVLKHIVKEFSSAGYNVNYFLLKASDYGVPQIRERIFIVWIRKDKEYSFEAPKKTGKIITAYDAINDLRNKEEDGTIPNHNEYSKAKKNKWQWNRAIEADKPGPTIRAEHHGNIEFHYNWTRRLTVRECARIQSFPDQFIFVGSGSSNYKQIWNAVPPVLARHVARALAKWLWLL